MEASKNRRAKGVNLDSGFQAFAHTPRTRVLGPSYELQSMFPN